MVERAKWAEHRRIRCSGARTIGAFLRPRWQLGDRVSIPPLVRPRRCIWGGDRETGTEGGQRKRHCLERSPEDVDANVLVDLYILGSDVGPLWS